jgi:hypothetical protein
VRVVGVFPFVISCVDDYKALCCGVGKRVLVSACTTLLCMFVWRLFMCMFVQLDSSCKQRPLYCNL